MDFVAIDFETADQHNSAPCALGMVVVEDGKTIEKKGILINPEVTFSRMATKIHGITYEDVKDAPTFPQIWPELSGNLGRYAVVMHNAGFDVGVLHKAAERYTLPVPQFSYYCTMQESKRLLQPPSTKLPDLCSYLGLTCTHHHDALADAEACAMVMLHLLDLGQPLNSYNAPSRETAESARALLDPFEAEILTIIAAMELDESVPCELVRYSKDKMLKINCYYRVIKIGTVRKRRFIGVREEYLNTVNCNLEHDSTKEHHRFFLESPQDIQFFENNLRVIIQKSHDDFQNYRQLVSEGTVEKHLKEYRQCTFDFLNSFA